MLRSAVLAMALAGSAALATPALATTPTQAPTPTHLEWTDCGEGVECATIEVPRDYAEPDGSTLGVALARRPATDMDARIGSLLKLPGGPGQSGVDLLTESPTYASERLQQRFDVISWDPRGIGRSEAVQCLDDAGKDAYLAALPSSPVTLEQVGAGLVQAKAFADGCAERSGDLLDDISATDAAKDLEAIRVALGEEQISLFGTSYGTYISTTYTAMHPDKVRAVVLDGPVDADTYRDDPFGYQLGSARANEESLQRFYAACAAEPQCPLDDPAAALAEVLSVVDRQPLTVETPAGPRPVTRATVLSAVGTALFDDSFFPILASALVAARDDADGQALYQLAGLLAGRAEDGTYDNGLDALVAVTCADSQGLTNWFRWPAALAQAAQRSPTLGVWSLTGYVPCAAWQGAPADLYQGSFAAPGSPPLLVVGATGDPATPYPDAQALTETLDNGVLLTREGGGHTSYNASECIQTKVDSYLIDVTVPEELICTQ